jgi:3-oxoacyl-[acyl-carrier protein] reductase
MSLNTNNSTRALDGRAAIVTGAAQGIGLAIADMLAAAGASVIVADLQEATGEVAAERIRRTGAAASFVQADVSDDESIRELVMAAERAFGRLDILVNNAGPTRRERAPFMEQDLALWDATHALMPRGYMIAARYAADAMRRAGGGNIVNISSVLARSVAHEPCAYHVTKAAVEQLTRYLAVEFGPQGIRVNAVAPGIVDRDNGRKLTDDPVNRKVAETVVPLRRAARADEIGRVVRFLCSDDASYLTGQVIVADGGLSLGEPFGGARRAYQDALSEHDEPQ